MRPYLLPLLAAVLCGGLHAGALTGRAWLLKPLMDDFLLPQLQADVPVSAGDLWRTLTHRAEPAPAAAQLRPQPQDDPSSQALRARLADSLRPILLAALLIALVLPLAGFGQIYLTAWVLGRVLFDIQQQLCAKLLALPLSFHHRTARGDTLSRVMNDAQRAHTSLDLVFGDVVQAALGMLIAVAVLVSISWQLTLVTFLGGPVIAAVLGAFGRRIRRGARRRQQSQGEITQRLLQILSGIKVIQAFRAEDHEERAFGRENLRLFRRNMRVVANRAGSRSIVEGINNAIGLAVVLAGAAAVASGMVGLSLGSLAAFALVLQEVYRPMKRLTKGWTRLMDAVPSAERFFELLDTPSAQVRSSGTRPIDGVQREIHISGVSFSYDREPVLREVSLEVSAGETVAIVGRTGSGKTTLADLLLRFYDPDRGSILVDGVDLREIDRDRWLDRVAVVSQEPFLFAGTIRDNIRYARPGAGEAEVRADAAAAHVDEFVDSLPQGYATEVGDAGVRLSGGQRQRVTIARAILKDPSLLIFDEATSALDARSERYVQEAIESLLAGRTVFIIAHRLSTVQHADKIVVLDQGRVAAVGRHRELMAQPGLYRELMTLQSRPVPA